MTTNEEKKFWMTPTKHNTNKLRNNFHSFNEIFFLMWTPIVGSLFFDYHLWSLFLNNLLIFHKNAPRWRHSHKIDASNDASASSLSFLVIEKMLVCFSSLRTAATLLWVRVLPFFFCSDFREDNFCWFELKKIWRLWDLNPQSSDHIHDE